MKKKFKVIGVLLSAVLLIVSLIGCGVNNENEYSIDSIKKR